MKDEAASKIVCQYLLHVDSAIEQQALSERPQQSSGVLGVVASSSRYRDAGVAS